MTTYFHCTPVLLGDGSVVEPGNWGRIVGMYSPDAGIGDAKVIARELMFEHVRANVAPDRPGRLSSLFCCPSLEGVRAFMKHSQRIVDVIYEIEPLHDCNLFYADWRLFRPVNGPFLRETEALALEYWKGYKAPDSEVLVEGPVRVLRAVKG